MSWLQTKTVTTFHDLNPDWEILVYVPAERSTSEQDYIPDYTGEDYFSEVTEKDYVQVVQADFESLGVTIEIPDILRSDILRYHLLHEHGGLWSDFDVLWMKPVSALSEVVTVGARAENWGATVCFSNDTHGWHNIGILAAMPGHPLYAELFDACQKKLQYLKGGEKLDHQEFGVNILNRLYPTLADIQRKYPDVAGISYDSFYPYGIQEMELLWEQNDLSRLKDHTLAVHWFNGHKLSKRFINNFPKPACSMREIILSQVIKAPEPGASSDEAATAPMPKVWRHDRRDLMRVAELLVKTTEKVLDIGAGIRPMTYFKPKLHVMAEPYAEYVEMLQHEYGDNPNLLVIQSEALDFVRMLPDRAFDSAFLLDVIEHLPKEDGLELIQELRRVTRTQIVVFTPLGFNEQDCETEGVDAWGLHGTAVQKHRSGWLPEDFPPDWHLHVCEDYHQINWKGESIEPFGALFALWTHTGDAPSPPHLSESQRHARSIMPDLTPETPPKPKPKPKPPKPVPSPPPVVRLEPVEERLDKLSKTLSKKFQRLEQRLAKMEEKAAKARKQEAEFRRRPRGFRRLKRSIRQAVDRLSGRGPE